MKLISSEVPSPKGAHDQSERLILRSRISVDLKMPGCSYRHQDQVDRLEFYNGTSVSTLYDIGSAISFVIVYGIGSFVTPWLKLLGQLLPWL